MLENREIGGATIAEGGLWRVVVTVAAAIEHERHQAAADNYGEDDTEPHSHVAGHSHCHIGEVPT